MSSYLNFIKWMFVGVLIIEAVVYSLVDEPVNRKKSDILTRYFDHGRSVESKIRQKVGTDNSNAAYLALAGWFSKPTPALNDGAFAGQRKNVTIYGMSFSGNIGENLAALDSELNIKAYGGPGAPLNHSYAFYRSHRPHEKNSVVILGILASSVPIMNSLTHMTTNFEAPGAHFFPRFLIDEEGQLVEKRVDLESLEELRAALQDKPRWDEIKSYLKSHDAFYDPIIFEENISDYSVFARLLKRSLAQQSLKDNTDRFHDQNGFKNTDYSIDVARSLVRRFAAEVREDGAYPYVILFSDRGYDSHLYEMLETILIEDGIAHYSTHFLFPAEQLSNFVPDGHFKPEIDTEIARVVLRDLKTMWGKTNQTHDTGFKRYSANE